MTVTEIGSRPAGRGAAPNLARDAMLRLVGRRYPDGKD